MGSYSCEDHRLPFLTPDDLNTASRINREVAAALLEETGEEYKGILYGSFIKTAGGLRIIEYNARFGDPECLNILSILETDFADICVAIIAGTLDRVPVVFSRKATVCKYVVPEGYPDAPVRNVEIGIPPELRETNDLRIFYGAVSEQPGQKPIMTGSRAIAFVGIGDTLAEAERIAENAASRITGPVFHREDIGTDALLQKRIDHMTSLCEAVNMPLRRAL
jgi:phosphoribosylamine--glycine ligase